MSKCDSCYFNNFGSCDEDNSAYHHGGRGCDDYEEDEDCGLDDEDLGYDQDKPWN